MFHSYLSLKSYPQRLEHLACVIKGNKLLLLHFLVIANEGTNCWVIKTTYFLKKKSAKYSNQSKCKYLSLWILCIMQHFLRGWLQILSNFPSTHSNKFLTMKLSSCVTTCWRVWESEISAFLTFFTKDLEIFGFYS